MRGTVRKILVVVFASIILIISYGYPFANDSKSIDEDDLGIRHEDLFDEDDVKPAEGEYPSESPGQSVRYMRAFENSPPLIPHDLTGMLPIVEASNMCMGCHMPQAATSSGAVAVPRSHLVDLDTGRDLGGELDGERYNCMQCHVPQVKIPAPVKNLFETEFRDEKDKYNSNLADILNEGVR